MMTYDELMRLKRELGNEQVLSVYIEAATVDPAQRDAWRARLRDALRPIEQAQHHSTHADREALQRCVAALEEYLGRGDHAPRLRTPALAAFVTASGVRHESRLPAPVPTVVYWERGARVAPYVRAIVPDRHAVVVAAGAAGAHVYTYDAGTLREVDHWQSPATDRAAYPMSEAPQLGFSPNSRGHIGKDERDRENVTTLQKASAQLVERIRRHAGESSWVVLTGNAQLTHAVMERLPGALAARTTVERSDSTDAGDEHTIARAAAAGVDALEKRRQSSSVTQAIDGALSGGRGALSVEATKAALAERCVQDLYFTERFAQEIPDELEVMIAIAYEQSARSEAVRDPAAAERLDREGGGVGALLRFPTPLRDPGAVTEAWRAASDGAHPATG